MTAKLRHNTRSIAVLSLTLMDPKDEPMRLTFPKSRKKVSHHLWDPESSLESKVPEL